MAASLAFRCQKRGILLLVNPVAGDERIARYRHPLPTRNEIQHTMMVALTSRRRGLRISLNRMVSFATPDSGLVTRHRAVVAVDARLNLGSTTGASLGKVISKGIGQYFHEGFLQEWEMHQQGGLTSMQERARFCPVGSFSYLDRNFRLTQEGLDEGYSCHSRQGR